MTYRYERTSSGGHVFVTVEAAARLVDVDVGTIRRWSESGSLEIQRRGDMDVVRLDLVRELAISARLRRGDTNTVPGSMLGALLRDATRVESESVAGLQELAREKGGTPRRGRRSRRRADAEPVVLPETPVLEADHGSEW